MEQDEYGVDWWKGRAWWVRSCCRLLDRIRIRAWMNWRNDEPGLGEVDVGIVHEER